MQTWLVTNCTQKKKKIAFKFKQNFKFKIHYAVSNFVFKAGKAKRVKQQANEVMRKRINQNQK